MIDIRKIAEAREMELKARQAAAMGRWKDYITITENHYKSIGRELSEYQKANVNIGVLVA